MQLRASLKREVAGIVVLCVKSPPYHCHACLFPSGFEQNNALQARHMTAV
jgi:hypothetical protein